MKKIQILLTGLILLAGLAIGTVTIPNPLGSYIISEAKASGYIEYTPIEAFDLAKDICTQCHTEDRIRMYCPRCGPPFVAVVPHMQTFVDNYRKTKPKLKVKGMTEPQAVAIVQVYNAIVGNWETDFREQDILKLIGGYELLSKLFLTPVEDRPIEYALSRREDLNIGHLSGASGLGATKAKPAEKAVAGDHKHKEGDDHDHE
ncbi:hypothetical protein MNBD_NITROSPINAE01-1498 [hydrothermal vent metagenome]|uniref:Uncharacterized protein n=1 Tax=hydrothermal vent metagenome TaxID=652676 RepID=A0A3B1CQV9_9ZZZZ